MAKMPEILNKFAIATANEELVLGLIATEAARLEALKEEGRAAARARGLADAEIDFLIPPYPAGAFSIELTRGFRNAQSPQLLPDALAPDSPSAAPL